MATEEPTYQILQTGEDYELRHYQPYRVAEVEVRGEFEQVGSEAFRILAGYIFGDNPNDTKIAMTAPVSQRSADDTAYVISFAMPQSFTLDALPQPNNPRIRLREEPAGRVAARRYSGTWSQERYREDGRRLLDALQRDGLQPRGVPIYARYNGPFSLPMFRRNEILIPLADTPDT